MFVTELIALAIVSALLALLVKWLAKEMFAHRTTFLSAFLCILIPQLSFGMLGLLLAPSFSELAISIAEDMREPDAAQSIYSALLSVFVVRGFFIQGWVYSRFLKSTEQGRLSYLRGLGLTLVQILLPLAFIVLIVVLIGVSQ